MSQIKITETVLRDSHQSLMATRLPYADFKDILPVMDKAGYYSVECWGGATFDSCMRFLNEDPWERLRKIRSATDTPLVLHGGSGLTDDDFRNTIKNGIAKVNIFTDLCLAGERACKRGLEENAGYLNMRNMKVEEIKKETMKKMLVFGCNGRA